MDQNWEKMSIWGQSLTSWWEPRVALTFWRFDLWSCKKINLFQGILGMQWRFGTADFWAEAQFCFTAVPPPLCVVMQGGDEGMGRMEGRKSRSNQLEHKAALSNLSKEAPQGKDNAQHRYRQGCHFQGHFKFHFKLLNTVNAIKLIRRGTNSTKINVFSICFSGRVQ